MHIAAQMITTKAVKRRIYSARSMEYITWALGFALRPLAQPPTMRDSRRGKVVKKVANPMWLQSLGMIPAISLE